VSLTLTSLRGARRTSDEVVCRKNLSQIMLLHSTASGINRDRWINDFEPDTPFVNWILGDTQAVADATLEQTYYWLGPFASLGLLGVREDPQGYSCPVAMRRQRDHLDPNWQIGPLSSYYYSAAMFTRAELWDPENLTVRQNPDDFRRSVGVYEVIFPSTKVVMSELVSYHGNDARLGREGSAPGTRANVAFADGHSSAVDLDDAQPALSVNWQGIRDMFNETVPRTLPFSSSAGGFRGYDF